jgi:hypothetical protein
VLRQRRYKTGTERAEAIINPAEHAHKEEQKQTAQQPNTKKPTANNPTTKNVAEQT